MSTPIIMGGLEAPRAPNLVTPICIWALCVSAGATLELPVACHMSLVKAGPVGKKDPIGFPRHPGPAYQRTLRTTCPRTAAPVLGSTTVGTNVRRPPSYVCPAVTPLTH